MGRINKQNLRTPTSEEAKEMQKRSVEKRKENKTMTDEFFDNILKQLKTASSNNERYEILKNNGLWNGKETEICERCKSAHKFGDLNMCVVVEWCKWDLSYKWFRKERQSQNSRDCKNFLDDECIKHSDSCSKDNHEKCMTCKHFEKKKE